MIPFDGFKDIIKVFIVVARRGLYVYISLFVLCYSEIEEGYDQLDRRTYQSLSSWCYYTKVSDKKWTKNIQQSQVLSGFIVCVFTRVYF